MKDLMMNRLEEVLRLLDGIQPEELEKMTRAERLAFRHHLTQTQAQVEIIKQKFTADGRIV